MVLPTFGDALTCVQAILSAALPGVEINILDDQADGFKRGLSVGAVGRGQHIVFLQEVGGRTLDHVALDNVRIEAITYTYGKPSVARAFARSVQRALWLAWVNQTVTPDGHLRFMETEVRPYIQQLQGIPTTISRTSATYSIGHRSRVAG